MPEYDDNNRISLWAPKDERRRGYYTGYGKLGGQKVYEAVLIMRDRQEDNQPIAMLWWRHEGCQKGCGMATPIYQNEKGMSGQIDDWWVNLFHNQVEPGSNRPVVSITFKAKEAPRPQEVGVTGPDHVPF